MKRLHELLLPVAAWSLISFQADSQATMDSPDLPEEDVDDHPPEEEV